MLKTVLKETCIMLLLCVAIVLILGVVFYDYIPANKAIPNKLATYSTPENVKEEIEQEVTGSDLNVQENYTYDITGADLSIYEKEGDYDAGKPDPFSASPTLNETNSEGNSDGTGNGSSGDQTDNPNSGSSGNSGSSTNQVADPNSTDTYFENQGLK